MIRDADFLDRRQIDDAQVVVLGLNRAGLDVILDVVGQAAEQKFIGRRAGRRLHVHLLPLGSARYCANRRTLGESNPRSCAVTN